MPRVKRGVTAHAKHKKVIAQAKGFRGRRGNDLLVLGARGYAAFDSWHGGSPLRVREHRADMLLVRSVHLRSSAQMAFVLGGFLGEDVALERLRALDAPTGADLEALGRAALGLHFGHCTAPVLAWWRVAPTERFPTSTPLLLKTCRCAKAKPQVSVLSWVPFWLPFSPAS